MAQHIREVSLMDVAVLLYMVHKAAQNKVIGYEDANIPLNQLTEILNKKVGIPISILESALWSSNMMDEIGNFSHPFGLTFDTWLEKMVGKGNFDKFYNILKEKK